MSFMLVKKPSLFKKLGFYAQSLIFLILFIKIDGQARKYLTKVLTIVFPINHPIVTALIPITDFGINRFFGIGS
ncbi:membrane protein [Candidatus Thiomargarita nelsonii]|uniref:Membrane protein n=1 Tax=Candidatus Thiomargarita nelsonii TaxID=1003181 RepID=A0A176RZ73_9GAMM|nr:membrane protein [Candidatus Thiomargarita nelsonii]